MLLPNGVPYFFFVNLLQLFITPILQYLHNWVVRVRQFKVNFLSVIRQLLQLFTFQLMRFFQSLLGVSALFTLGVFKLESRLCLFSLLLLLLV